MAKTVFSNYWFDEKFQDLPRMDYDSKDKTLDLIGTSVKIVPAGLRGVDEIRLSVKPEAIAPDFKGRIVFAWGVGCFSEVTEEETKIAKNFYEKYKKFCETPHSWAGKRYHTDYENLPNNMHFVTIGDRTFLDLRQSNVDLDRSMQSIYGVEGKDILLPNDSKKRIARAERLIGKPVLQKQKN